MWVHHCGRPKLFIYIYIYIYTYLCPFDQKYMKKNVINIV